MCGCDECGRGYGHHGHCRGGRRSWTDDRPGFGRRESRDEMIGDLEEYKENLEAEIRRLEKRIGSLKAPPTPA